MKQVRYNSQAMITIKSLATRVGLAAGAAAMVAALGSTAPASAQPSYAVRQESIKGIVRSYDGRYNLYVRDRHGYLDHVLLHQGTIINPTGLRLEAGMRVTVYGHPEGDVFAAQEIDTPYRFIPPIDYYPFGYGPWWPHPWGWGFGWNWGWRPW
jgi:hypothetical protein